MSRQVNLIEIQLEYMERRRTRLFIRAKKRNRPIGVFEASSMVEKCVRNGEPLRLKRRSSDLKSTLQINPCDLRYKSHQLLIVGSRSDARDCVLAE